MSPTPWLQVLGDALGRLFFPRVCVACSREINAGANQMACASCWQRLVALPYPRCPRCGHPSGRRAGCVWCDQLPETVSQAASLCWADDPVGQRLVHALKYEGWHQLGVEMGRRLGHAVGAVTRGADTVLIPVPLAERRLRERGYNQSEALARGLLDVGRGRLHTDVLRRKRETPSQTRLTPEQRLHNVADAFHVDTGRLAELRTSVCVLIDDVITTGATMNACAAALADAGVGNICYLTFGRARDPRDRPSTNPDTHHGNSRRH